MAELHQRLVFRSLDLFISCNEQTMDLQDISIQQYIGTANKYHGTILYLIHVYKKILIEQSVIALLL